MSLIRERGERSRAQAMAAVNICFGEGFAVNSVGTDDWSVDEKALYSYVCSYFGGNVPCDSVIAKLTAVYKKPFDIKSLLSRLEVFYADALSGNVRVGYPGQLQGLCKDMDRMYMMILSFNN